MEMPRKQMTTAKKTKVIGTKTYIDPITGEHEEMQVVSIEDRDFNFVKIWIGHIVSALEAVGNQKIKVITYLMENMTTENYIIESQRKIAKSCNVSLETVRQTMKALQEADIIRMKQRGVYMLNPNCIFKGNHKKRMNVLIQYHKLDSEEKKSKRKALEEHGLKVIDGGEQYDQS